MSANFIQEGDTIVIEAPATVASGDGVLLGTGLFGVAVTAASSGDDVPIKTTGVFALAKVSAQAWAAGDLIYWDSDNDQATNVDGTGEYLIGVAVRAEANPTATGRVRLNGTSVS